MPANPNPTRRSKEIVENLEESKIFRDYAKAFTEATGLPLAIRAPASFNLALRGKTGENPFCVLMAGTNQTCAACLRLQHQLEVDAKLEPKTLKCFAGLCDTAVPIRVGDDLVAFLQTGQILLHHPSREQFSRTTRQLLKLGKEIDVKKLEEAYFQTRVVSRTQYESIVRLLAIFAQHLASLSNQLMVHDEKKESPLMKRAVTFIEDHQDEDITLKEVAKAVNTSAFYFCKMFKQATGLTFTNYLARVRVEKVKNLLLNPHKRISEAAFETGFQSLSQFNRTFRKVTGESPTVYRKKLLRAG